MACSVAGRSLNSDRPSGLVGRYVATGSFRAGRYEATLFGSFFRCFMNLFLDYGCLISMDQPRLVQDFSAKLLVKIYLRRILFVKTFMLTFTDIWMLTSSCPFLTPTQISPDPINIINRL